MPQIITIKDLRDTTKISKMCNATNEPIFIATNGHIDMVVMSMTTYERQFAAVDMHKKIMEGKAQADRGELKDGPSVMEKLRSKYGG